MASNFISTPNRYGITLADSVFPQTPPGNTPGAGVVLVAKVCDALLRTGWDSTALEKVGGLVAANIMTCLPSEIASFPADGHCGGMAADGVGSAEGQSAVQVELILRALLDNNIERSRTVHVNSNEPVLLVNFFDDDAKRFDPARALQIVDEATKQCQHAWNIWPVRVYAGHFLTQATGAKTTGDAAFAITILNVVNTDIGGPSMVQLLDEPCDAEEWHRVMRRDVWRNRSLVTREQRAADPRRAELESASSDESVHGSDAASVDSEHSGPKTRRPEIIQDPSPDSVADQESPPAPRQNEPGQLVDPGVADDEVSGVEFDLAGGQSLARRVEHPSWDRLDDSVSLLDLIRSQASVIAPFSGDALCVEPREDEAVGRAAGPDESVEKKSDAEDFVVVPATTNDDDVS